MYDVIYMDEYWWITKDGRILEELGGFIDPISPEIIVREINGEISI